MPLVQTRGAASIQGFAKGTAPVAPLPNIGDSYAGGYYAGNFRIGSTNYALIMSPKAQGQANRGWGAANVNSAIDGFANTVAAASAGYPANFFTRGLSINGYTDWYTPARDELEILYRNFKPDTVANSVGNRVAAASGDTVFANGSNLNSVPIGAAYTTTVPEQTPLPLFQTGGAECLDPVIYWCSTGSDSGQYQLLQRMNDGIQSYDLPNTSVYSVRAVRKIAI